MHEREIVGGARPHVEDSRSPKGELLPHTTDRPTRPRIRSRRPLPWVFLGVALALLIAGIAAPHAVVLAAGLIVAGLIGLGHRR